MLKPRKTGVKKQDECLFSSTKRAGQRFLRKTVRGYWILFVTL